MKNYRVLKRENEVFAQAFKYPRREKGLVAALPALPWAAALVVPVLILLLFSIASCDSQNNHTVVEDREKFKVLFLIVGKKEVDSWDRPHYAGALYLKERLKDNIEVFTEDQVPEEKEAIKSLLDKYTAQGLDMVFAASFGYGEILHELAPNYPDVLFEHCAGYLTGDNLSVYFGRFYQARYLTGIVAGLMTKTGRIGYIGSFRIPQVIRGINAFTLGVKAVNPRARVLVYWGLTWGDPEVNRSITVDFLDNLGVDIVAHHQSALTIGEEAAARGKYVIGNNFDMREAHGDTVLVSPVWRWGNYYVERVKKAIIGAWSTNNTWGSMLKHNGFVTISGFSAVVPEVVRQRVNQAYKQITSGSWDVFWGPIRDQQNTLIVPAGGRLSDEDLLSMDYLVAGVTEAGTFKK